MDLSVPRATAVLMLLVAAFWPAGFAAAESQTPESPVSQTPASDLAIDYCRSFGQAAVDARHARQKKELAEMKQALETKLEEVRKQSERLADLLDKHDAIMSVATKDFVKIYEATEPAAAAQQLEKVEPWVSATILRRLKPKLAGEILSVMATEKAARLVTIMTSQNMNERKTEGSKAVASQN